MSHSPLVNWEQKEISVLPFSTNQNQVCPFGKQITKAKVVPVQTKRLWYENGHVGRVRCPLFFSKLLSTRVMTFPVLAWMCLICMVVCTFLHEKFWLIWWYIFKVFHCLYIYSRCSNLPLMTYEHEYVLILRMGFTEGMLWFTIPYNFTIFHFFTITARI